MERVYASIYEFRDLQILPAETCKNPRLLNYFQLAHTGYKSTDFIYEWYTTFYVSGSFCSLFVVIKWRQACLNILFLNLKLKFIITSLRSLLLKSVAVFINFYMVIYKFPTMAILIVGSYLRSLGMWSSMWTGSLASLQIIVIEKVWIHNIYDGHFFLFTDMIHRKWQSDLMRGKGARY